MGLSRSLTVALPHFFIGLALLAVTPMFAKADGISTAIEHVKPANNPPVKISNPTVTLSSNSKVTAIAQSNTHISLQKLDDKLLLEARHAPLIQILKTIADKTGALIHYSVLPQAPVTATCAGLTVKAVMECLLGNRVDRIYRQMPATKGIKTVSLNGKVNLQPIEIWLMGSRFSSVPNTMQCTLDGNRLTNNPTANNPTPDLALLRMAQVTGDPRFTELKKQAIAILAAQGKTGNPALDDEVIDTLQQALTDPDAETRAQAVFGMMNQDSTNTEVLHDALQDNNPDVRLMAVDSADANNPAAQAILQEALNDRDETVKAAASAKLGIEYSEPGQ